LRNPGRVTEGCSPGPERGIFLVLDFVQVFEDEDENEEDGPLQRFALML
jgi:hypothetical protein